MSVCGVGGCLSAPRGYQADISTLYPTPTSSPTSSFLLHPDLQIYVLPPPTHRLHPCLFVKLSSTSLRVGDGYDKHSKQD